MNNSEFKIFSLLFTIFTPEILFKKSKILQHIMEDYSDKFDGDIISLPLPDDAPADIPRLILSDSYKKFRFEVAKSRANFHIFSKEAFEIESNFKSYLDLYFDLIKKYKECTNATIGRIGIVIKKFIEKDNPTNYLFKYFCNEKLVNKEIFNYLNDFELNFRKRYSLKNFKINSWVKCKNGKLNIGNKQNLDSILVIQDINTLLEELESKNYSIQDLKKFIEITLDEQSSILKSIFPKGVKINENN